MRNLRNPRNHLLIALGVVTGLSLPPALAGQPTTPASLVPCPYTPEEIEESLGVKVQAGEAADMTFPAGRDVGCLYQVAGGSTTLAVRQTWDPTGRIGSASQVASKQGKKGKAEPIPGDPDGAQWTTGGRDDDEPWLLLSYNRGKVQIRALLHGKSFREADMKPRLLKLKRVP